MPKLTFSQEAFGFSFNWEWANFEYIICIQLMVLNKSNQILPSLLTVTQRTKLGVTVRGETE